LLQQSLSVCRSAQTLRGSVADTVMLLEEAREQAIAKKILFGHTVSVVHLERGLSACWPDG